MVGWNNEKLSRLVLLLTGIIVLLFSGYFSSKNAYSQIDDSPTVRDDGLVVEQVFKGPIKGISNMAFLDTNDILVLDRINGTVKRIVNGTILPEPLLDVNVTVPDGLLGIDTSSSNNSKKYVFLYYTESPKGYGNDIDAGDPDQAMSKQLQLINNTYGYIRECNCIYKYELINNKLVNGSLLVNSPARPEGKQHHGGEIEIGPDNNIYAVVGNLETKDSKAVNSKEGVDPDGRAGILRVTQNGKAVGEGILGNKYPLNLYYAYGIRNSFGIDFDPLTGNLWDTENGPDYGDEINLVRPGFNSGWKQIMGHSNLSKNSEFDVDSLVDFGGKGKYSDPEFTWEYQVGPTAIRFLDSDKLGKEYENDMFVADVNNGTIYHFDLNENRTELVLNGSLRDKIANTPEEIEPAIFAEGFVGGITDLQVGPDGYLYVLAGPYLENKSIYKILPRT